MEQHPSRIHIPPLFEGTEQLISWSPVSDAQVYIVEAAVDGAFDEVPATLIYEGPGIPAPGPDVGRTWWEIGRQQQTWDQVQAMALNWDDCAVLSTPGKSWNSWGSRFQNWHAQEAQQLSWDELSAQAPDSEALLSVPVSVPNDIQSMRFRVCAGTGAEMPDWTQTTRQSIVARTRYAVGLVAGKGRTISVKGEWVRRLQDAVFQLQYNPKHLRFLDISVLEAEEQELPAAYPVLLRHSDGVLKFTCEREIEPGSGWDGLVIGVKFCAEIDGSTEVILERSNRSEKPIL